MQEYEIYLPSSRNDGAPVDPEEIERIKHRLTEAFGGYTHLKQSSEGAWCMGGVTFHDEVTIVRVLDDGSAQFHWEDFKGHLEKTFQQQSLLIVTREVKTV